MEGLKDLRSKFINDMVKEITTILNESEGTGEKSKNMSRIISSFVHVLMNTGKGEYLMKEVSPIYQKLHKKHNEIYNKLGGVNGSGELVASEVENSGINLEGIGELAFNLFQVLAIKWGHFANQTGDPLIHQINIALWSSLLTVHDNKAQKKLLKLSVKYDTRLS